MPLRWPPFALAAAIVALDQLTKAWVVAEVPLGARVASWAGLVHLTHTRNTGAAFGLLGGFSLDLGAVTIDGVQLLGLVSLLVAVALAVWLARARELGWGTRLALGAVMGGAIGNGIDRWRLHYVVDFVHLQAGWFDFPVFNVADMGISIGAGLLLLATLLRPPAGTIRSARHEASLKADPRARARLSATARLAAAPRLAGGASPGGDALSDAPSRTDDDR
jgi:signal peptidase II